MFVLVCLVSFLPFILLFLWLRRQKKEDEAYQKLCGSALKQGIISVLPIILFSALSHIVVRLTGFHESNPLLYQALYTFIVLALVEEIMKYRAFRKVWKKTDYPCSWLDVVCLCTIAAIGFGLIESVIYAIGASIPVVLVRGICVPHVGYGFLVGYFYGKGCRSGRSGEKWTGFGLAWLLHGLYDFSLSEEFIALNDNLVMVALLLALAEIVLVIILIRFVRKARKNEIFLEPLREEESM